MCRVITAPEKVILEEGEITCFLAGGISGCDEWQDKVIEELLKKDTDKLVLLNPRRKDFDISNPNAADEQITWEFNALNDMDIFSMYFDNSDSVQPICFYELGRHLERMQHRFTHDWKKRIIVDIKDGFSRKNDVFTQTVLALSTAKCVSVINDPVEHANEIFEKYEDLIKEN